MDGIEKITARIQADGQAELDRLKEDVRQQLQTIHTQTQDQVDRERQDILSEAFDKALEQLCALPDEQYIQLLTHLVLQAVSTGKEQLVFSPKDRNRIGKQVVVAANEALVKNVAPELPESITDSKVGAFVGKLVNSATAQITGTGLLSLSEETRNIRGGFILVDGPIEVNCAFETLVRLQREKLEKQVADILFEA